MINPKVALLREVVVKLTPMIAGKGLRVTQVGAKAFAAVDPKTLKPVRINIPHIADDADDAFLMAIQGFIDHEVAHILFTDWKAVQATEAHGEHLAAAARRDPKTGAKDMHWFHNVVEDPFIERLMQNKFKGSAYNLDRLHEMFLERITKPAVLKSAVDPIMQFGVLLVPITRAWSGQVAFERFMKDNKYWDLPLVKAFVDALPKSVVARMPTLKTSWDCLEIADEYYKVLRPYIPPPPPPPPPPPAAPPCEAPPPESEEDESEGSPEPKPGEKTEADGEGKNEDKPEDAEDKGTGGEEAAPETDEDEADEADEADAGGGEAAGEEGSGDDDTDDEADSDDEDEEGADGAGGEPDDAGEDEADAEEAGDPVEAGTDDEEGEEEGSGSDGEKDEESSDADAAGDPDAASDEGGAGENEPSAGGSADPDEDDGEGEAADAAPGTGSSPFSEKDVEVEGIDISSAISGILTDMATKATRDADYRVYTRDMDKIEELKIDPRLTPEAVATLEDQTRHMVAPMQKNIERMMASKSQVLKVPGFRSGRLHSAGLHRLATKDDRIFRRRHETTSKETAVTLLIDNSGSMSQDVRGKDGSYNTKIAVAMAAGYALSQTLERVGIKHEVIGFTTVAIHHRSSTMGKYLEDLEAEEARIGRSFSRMEPLHMPIFKGFDERLTPETKKRFAMPGNGCMPLLNNVDGECLRIAALRLVKRTEKRKVIIVLSDGNPVCSTRHTGEINSDLHRAVTECGKMHIDLVGLGIMDDSVREFYPKCSVLKDLADLPGAVMGELKRILTAA